MTSNKTKLNTLLSLFILLAIGILFVSSCSKTNDKKAYDEAIATMSTDKAKRFFDNYPESQYRDKLANEIIGWCKQEETDTCYKMIIDALPESHPKYKEVAEYYETHFVEKKK